MSQKQLPKPFVKVLNKKQQKYLVLRKLNEEYDSKNLVYYGCLRQFPKQQNNNDDTNTEENQKMYDKKNAYALKLLEANNRTQLVAYTRTKNILFLFRDDPRIIQNEEVIEIETRLNKYLMVPTKFYDKKDALDFIWSEKDETYDDYDISELVRIVTFQALHLLVLLKSRHVVHNDFKFENMIVTETPVIKSPDFPFNILLLDFDDAEQIREKSKIIGGTKVFNAPEVQISKEHDYSVDIWSLGVNIYYNLCRVLPFDIKPNESDIKTYGRIKKGKLINYKNRIPELAWKLLEKMLVFKPEDRITPENALNMEWFEGLDPIVVEPIIIQTNLETGVKDEYDE